MRIVLEFAIELISSWEKQRVSYQRSRCVLSSLCNSIYDFFTARYMHAISTSTPCFRVCTLFTKLRVSSMGDVQELPRRARRAFEPQ